MAQDGRMDQHSVQQYSRWFFKIRLPDQGWLLCFIGCSHIGDADCQIQRGLEHTGAI